MVTWGLPIGGGYESSLFSSLRPFQLLLLRLQQLIALLEYREDGLRRAGVEAEPTAFQAPRRVEFIGRGRKPCTRRANRHANGLVCATIRVADQVIADDHHRLDSFEETLREDLKHVLVWQAAHFHSLMSALSRSFNSGICSRLFSIAPTIFSMRADRNASLSSLTRRSYSA